MARSSEKLNDAVNLQSTYCVPRENENTAMCGQHLGVFKVFGGSLSASVLWHVPEVIDIIPTLLLRKLRLRGL
jgi:hypothetical protein